MPYIKSDNDRRQKLQQGDIAQNAGELNYQIFYITKHSDSKGTGTGFKDLVKQCVDRFLGEKPNYQKFNDMTGALIRCYIEIKRRLQLEIDYLLELCASYDEQIAKYEDIKIIENSDVE